MSICKDNLTWIDLEMTGLDPDQDYIIEIATVVTDNELNELGTGPVLTMNPGAAVLEHMDRWNREHHAASGLLARVHDAAVTAAEAERQTLEFLRKLVPPGASPMCGNSICQDRRFLARRMPRLAEYFHYRNLDVSTLKELYKRWYPDAPVFTKESAHLALEDVRDSIAELRFYREHLLRWP